MIDDLIPKLSCVNYSFEDCEGLALMMFFRGCNLRCKYCYNIDIAKGKQIMEPSLIKDYLSKDMKYVDCLVLTGGEPLLQDEKFLIDLIINFKKLNPDIKIKVDTNGLFPEKIEKLIPYVDIFAIDIKRFPFERYTSILNEPKPPSEEIKKNLNKTLDILKNHVNNVNMHFRTVLLKDLNEGEIETIESFLKDKFEDYFGSNVIYYTKEELDFEVVKEKIND